MNIGDIINKSSPFYKQKEMSKSEYKKLVDRNTELIDTIKDLQEIRKKAIEYIEQYCIDDEFYINLTEKEKNIIDVYNILKGNDDSV